MSKIKNSANAIKRGSGKIMTMNSACFSTAPKPALKMVSAYIYNIFPVPTLLLQNPVFLTEGLG